MMDKPELQPKQTLTIDEKKGQLQAKKTHVSLNLQKIIIPNF